MTENSVDQLPAKPEQVVSPQALSELFNTAAERMLSTGRGQRLGSYVVAYENQAGIKQHPVKGRVTHAQLISGSVTSHPVVTHEVHLPSRDKQAGDFEADKAIFETHQYDESGNRTSTERTIVNQIDMAGSEARPFIEQINGLKLQ